MISDRAGRVGEQNAAYRKGMVLGLTMAEVGILIIFVLLLLIAFEEIRRVQMLSAFENKEAVARDRLQELLRSETALKEVAKEVGADDSRPPEDFSQLVRIVAAIAKSPDGSSALKEATRILDEMKEAVGHVQSIVKGGEGTDTADVLRRVELQGHRLANQEGQLKRYETMLAAAGQGKGERPCWVRPDGTIDYLYEVVLQSDGIQMREIIHAERGEERKLLSMPEIDPAVIYSEGEFLNKTRPLYNHSLAANCRFFVVVYDGTAVHEKPVYKNLLRTVEGHFYKRLSNAAPPF